MFYTEYEKVARVLVLALLDKNPHRIQTVGIVQKLLLFS